MVQDLKSPFGGVEDVRKRAARDTCRHVTLTIENRMPNNRNWCCGWTVWYVFEDSSVETHNSTALLCPGQTVAVVSDECINEDGGLCCTAIAIEVRAVNGQTLNRSFNAPAGTCWTGGPFVLAPKSFVARGARDFADVAEIVGPTS